MNKYNLTKKEKITIFIIMIFTLSISIVSAGTSAKLHFCEYAGVLRTLKILGILLNIVKVVIPIIFMITSIMSISKTIFSGKFEDLTGSFMLMLKKLLAGLIIFFIPGLIDYAFDALVEYDIKSVSEIKECTTCLLDIDNCTIPDTDPEIYK